MFVIGTAGHVDHGKSALINRLTGIDPDRLREEKERGMTIDLGFAWLKLKSGEEVGIIDVPGHERFIKNMLSGVGAIDITLFIVAANESIKPQTIEHLEILKLLDIKQGIVVITKKDLVDSDTLSLVSLEIGDLVAETFLEKAPIIAVSSVTGEGFDDLEKEIENMLEHAQRRKDIGMPRLYVDRIFTITGAGTVVTGTLIEGTFSVSQEVEILPSGKKARIRGLQSHKAKKQSVKPASRVAINLASINTEEIVRGDVISLPGLLLPSSRMDCKLKILKDLPNPLRHGAEVSFFTGSAEVNAKLHLLNLDEVTSGMEAWIQVTTDKPLAVVKGDHFIIRSPMRTLGGGVIMNPVAVRHKRYHSGTISQLTSMESDIPEDVILSVVGTEHIIKQSDLLAKSKLVQEAINNALQELFVKGRLLVFEVDKDRYIFTPDHWQKILEKSNKILKQYHARYAVRQGMPKGEFINKLGISPGSPLLRKLFADKLVVEEGVNVRHPDHRVSMSAEQQQRVDQLMNMLNKNPYAPQLDMELDVDLLKSLIEQKNIVKVAEGVIFSRQAYDEMVDKISQIIRSNGKITVAQVRDMFSTSRKYALALLEYMDSMKITKRVGDERVLR
ncbi:MAG TPA: selenocysteine-specific translation elongation factor [Dehalococcoidia bacterium]|nr:selenocysteine-specific translation elongation factor [Dehalococcoidia bacterium]